MPPMLVISGSERIRFSVEPLKTHEKAMNNKMGSQECEPSMFNAKGTDNHANTPSKSQVIVALLEAGLFCHWLM